MPASNCTVKKLIQSFISRVNVDSQVDQDWRTFVREQKEQDLARIIDEEKLKLQISFFLSHSVGDW